jgi:ABC-type nickel/cobalt efflux system permease component RcnA
MSKELGALLTAALSIGFFHTLIGPDHYIPFVMMARARKWSGARTAVVTFFCGIAHILSSVLLGLIGIFFGVALQKLVRIESVRGSVAAWLLIAFGLAYGVWSFKQVMKNRSHGHGHVHEDGRKHVHEHVHADGHVHMHEGADSSKITPWVLFTIFIFGPCEPLIPLLMFPAAKNSLTGMALVTAVFGAATILTMLAMVQLALRGFRLLPFKALEKYSGVIAGAVIFLTGIAILLLGL